MKSKLFLWSSAIAGLGSALWVLSLAALVVGCKLLDTGFPVLAKFSPYRGLLLTTDRLLQAFPFLALLALALFGIGWYRERSFRTLRPAALAVGLSFLLSALVIAFNPAGYLSWFLS